jgi:hypothetical protein
MSSSKTKEWRMKNKELLKEKNKKYYEANKEVFKLRANNYYANHRNEVLEAKKQQYTTAENKPFICECGAICKELSRRGHLKTQKHLKFVSSKN